jgi:hypothetical protein
MIHILFLAIIFSLHTHAQDTTTIRNDYKLKAKNQNTAGWVILGTGFTVFTIGLAIEMSEVTTDIAYALTFQEREHRSTGTTLLIAGGVTMLSSMPFFLASSRNRKRVATAFHKMESQTTLKDHLLVKTSFPAVGIRVSL